MKTSVLACAVLLTVGLASLPACHHGSSEPSDAAMMPPSPDLTLLGDMASGFPAVTKPDVPIVTSQGGPIMTAPKVVVITFPGEAMLSDIQTFVSTLGATSYWQVATADYQVGAITMLTSIQSTTVPAASITDDDIQAFLSAQLDGTHPEYPAPDDNTIYALFYPETTTISDGGNSMSCASGGFGGYHADMGLASGDQRVTYAVLPRCTNTSLSAFDYLTASASHEFLESTEDPQPFTMPAFLTVDDAHFEYVRLVGGGESADLCALVTGADFKPAGFDYYVQRNYSNTAAAMGEDPCIPAVGGTPAYFNISPVTPFDQITLTEGGQSEMLNGFSIPVGTTRVIDLELFSDAALPGPLTISARDETSPTASPFKLSFDKTQGKNGDHVKLSITANSTVTAHSGTETLLIATSYTDSTTTAITSHSWYGLFATPVD